MIPAVDRVFVHPIKSLDRVAVEEARILANGMLEHDREFALFDKDLRRINGKRNSRIHLIRAEFNLTSASVSLSGPGESQPRTFQLLDDREAIEKWFSDFFGSPVYLMRDPEAGFPDDPDASGPTIIGSATLDEVGSWFSLADREETGRRFRANIELGTDVAFWEDRLFGREGEEVEFQVGDVAFRGVNPCQRCVVPSRHPDTGAVTDEFQRLFAERRAATLPSWAEPSRFNHFYRLSVNTKVPQSERGKVLRAGDPVSFATCFGGLAPPGAL